MFQEFPTLIALMRVRSCLLPGSWKGQILFPQLPLAARSRVYGLGSAYFKQELVTQRSWGSAKSFLVAKSIVRNAGAAMTITSTQHPTPAVPAVGTGIALGNGSSVVLRGK